jgi:hypothetical protein
MTPEYIEWCKLLQVFSLAEKRSNRVEILIGNKIRTVDIQSIYES